ncbi:ABC transporter ATP-binding protein [Streptomyces sp. SID3343]|uniref:ABC transporter ATP-binding protein n=1 Tax=Streptomyces sp. SID3343 TaxID=2690260 RepID=UPI00136E72E1|nr:ABC transporter ATP-binding protein [Streptomyces sp. SID3343]MYW02127.1 ATP-binding cassette domain-containing protein [Streptomyces sp. SID3343]
MLELENLHVFYGAIQALKGVSIEVNEGEIVALLGANGAGKTTTLRTISGLLTPREGEVRWRGERIDGVPAHHVVGLGIGHSPEGRRVFAAMTVTENLNMGAYRFKHVPKAELDRVFELFPRLAERRTQLAGTLSGGEQQMLAIGRALMGQPKLLLLDEPSMGLAPLIVAQIFDIIREINEQGTTVLLVEQNAAQALRLAHRGYALETGSVVLSGPSERLLSDPKVREAYLGEGA